MVLTSIHTEDIVHCDKLGVQFFAKVEDKPARGKLRVKPLDRRITYFEVKANQVIGHYRKSKNSR